MLILVAICRYVYTSIVPHQLTHPNNKTSLAIQNERMRSGKGDFNWNEATADVSSRFFSVVFSGLPTQNFANRNVEISIRIILKCIQHVRHTHTTGKSIPPPPNAHEWEKQIENWGWRVNRSVREKKSIRNTKKISIDGGYEGQLLIKACVCEFRRPAAAAERPIDVDAEIDLKPITLVQLDYCYYYCSSSSSLGLATIRCETDGLSRVLFHFLELFRLLSFTYITLSCNTWAKIHQRRTTTTT